MAGLKLADLRLFLATADAESFVVAGRAHGLTGSAASKAVARLEGLLGARLFQRTSHSIRLTEEGRTFSEHARRVLSAAHAAQTSLDASAGEPRGTLRVSLPDAFGRSVVLPIAVRYLERWSDVRLDLEFTDRPVDVVDEGLDVVVRLAPITAPGGMIARVLTHFRASLCASPTYLARHGHPPHLDALSTHECLVFRTRARSQSWRFLDDEGNETRIPVRGRLRANSAEALRAAALLDRGIAYLPAFLIEGDIADGRLVPVLPDLAQGEAPVVALYPSRRHLTARVRRFVDLLAEELGGTSMG
ncbi:LysR family transcriptional regulator [Enhygromyxa salina]|uniref:HTH-type transcriptional regulator DmlR n=1 Tax=Enhygromyxa salina TaxID=215803 RepID=A0A2S9Y5W0_9BACT|nr:LysR family transcriptional regulator [Enhygromyxa salina]PRQ00475.1 HTH-type transcriptional regulator DmlR [Enhygromyxa salina]